MTNYHQTFRLFLQIFSQALTPAKIDNYDKSTQVYQSHILRRQVMAQQYPSQSSKMVQYSYLSLLKKTFPAHRKLPIWTASTISKAQNTKALQLYTEGATTMLPTNMTTPCQQTIADKQLVRSKAGA